MFLGEFDVGHIQWLLQYLILQFEDKPRLREVIWVSVYRNRRVGVWFEPPGSANSLIGMFELYLQNQY